MDFLDYLREVDIRAAYVDLGFNSLYHYVTEGLGYSSDQAYLRINAIRIINKVPEVKQKLEDNSFTLSTLAIATQIVSATDGKETLESALMQVEGKTKNEAKEIVYQLKKPSRPMEQEKRITITLTNEEYEMVQEVLSLKNKEAKVLLLAKCKEEKQKLDRESNKIVQTTSRHIPVQVRREVLKRAKFQCEHLGCQGKKHLEFAHIKAYSKGGEHRKENIRLLCHVHHKYETFLEFGRRLR